MHDSVRPFYPCPCTPLSKLVEVVYVLVVVFFWRVFFLHGLIPLGFSRSLPSCRRILDLADGETLSTPGYIDNSRLRIP